MSDIVQELLSRASDEAGIGWTPTTVIHVPARLLHHAADRIAQLEAALRGLIDIEDGPGMAVAGWSDAMDRARAALEGK